VVNANVVHHLQLVLPRYHRRLGICDNQQTRTTPQSISKRKLPSSFRATATHAVAALIDVSVYSSQPYRHQLIRALKRLISLLALIARLIFFNRVLIAVLTHILFVTFFNCFMFHWQSQLVDVVGPPLLNASLYSQYWRPITLTD